MTKGQLHRLRAVRLEADILQEATTTACSTLDVEAILEAIPRLLCRWRADECVVDFFDGPERRTVGTVSWEKVQAGSAARALACVAIARGRPLVVTARDAIGVDEPRLADRVAQVRAVLGGRWFAVCPLLSRTKPLGSVTMFSASKPMPDLVLLASLGERLGLGLGNARAHRRLLEERNDYEQALSFMTHDLRGSLGVVRFALSEAQRVAANSDPALSRFLGRAERSALRMDELTKTVLDIARAESNRLPLEKKPESPEGLVADAIAFGVPHAESKEVSLFGDVADHLPDVRCDRQRITRVLANLVGNAIKFTPRHGRVAVCARRVRRGVCFEVTDTGVGISLEVQQSIFEPYFQRVASSREGVGLGLAIVKAFIEAHGAHVSVESKAGQGATFRFTLPVDESRGAPVLLARTAYETTQAPASIGGKGGGVGTGDGVGVGEGGGGPG